MRVLGQAAFGMADTLCWDEPLRGDGAPFPEEFKQGMVSRAEILGDTGENSDASSTPSAQAVPREGHRHPTLVVFDRGLDLRGRFIIRFRITCCYWTRSPRTDGRLAAKSVRSETRRRRASFCARAIVSWMTSLISNGSLFVAVRFPATVRSRSIPMFLPNALAEVYQEWRRHGMRRRRAPSFCRSPTPQRYFAPGDTNVFWGANTVGLKTRSQSGPEHSINLDGAWRTKSA